jgi:hypothetical protein
MLRVTTIYCPAKLLRRQRLHCQGFELLEPMLILATELNPGFHYNLSVAGDTFVDVAVVFPYARDMLASGYFRPIVGVDIAHMNTIIMSNLPRSLLSKMYLKTNCCMVEY